MSFDHDLIKSFEKKNNGKISFKSIIEEFNALFPSEAKSSTRNLRTELVKLGQYGYLRASNIKSIVWLVFYIIVSII